MKQFKKGDLVRHPRFLETLEIIEDSSDECYFTAVSWNGNRLLLPNIKLTRINEVVQ